jgi:hypothetical protein
MLRRVFTGEHQRERLKNLVASGPAISCYSAVAASPFTITSNPHSKRSSPSPLMSSLPKESS